MNAENHHPEKESPMKIQHPFEITSNTGTHQVYAANAQEARRIANAHGTRGFVCSAVKMLEGVKARRPMPPIRPQRKEPAPRPRFEPSFSSVRAPGPRA